MKKLDYSKSYRKKIVQQIVFNDLKQRGINKIVGLAGPNITDYLSFVKSKGFKTAEIYEYDAINLMQQLNNFQPVIQTRILYQDIYTAPLYQDAVYDLDFTCSLLNAKQHIKKFNKNAVVTVSLRPLTLISSLKMFSKTISKLKSNIRLNVHKTKDYVLHLIEWQDGRSYNVYQYADTCQMLTFKPNY